MIGFLKNLFSGIISFFTGLFDRKQSQENKPSTPSAEKLKEATSSAAEKLKETTSSPVEKLTDATSSAAEKLTDATASSNSGIFSSINGLVGGKKPQAKQKRSGYFMELDEAEEKKPVNGNEPAKATAAAKPASSEAKEQAPKVELVQTAEGIKAEPAKRPSSPAASANGQKQTETTFAPKYLMPSSSNRRRPGPNMNQFLDMARQVNPG